MKNVPAVVVIVAVWFHSVPAAEIVPPAEPNVEIASTWWPPLTNVYTPIGWKNHLFRFNVFFDGTLLAQPDAPGGIDELAQWKDMGAQLMILPSHEGLHPYAWRSGTSPLTTDNGRRWGYQGWTDDDAPVLWTEWRQSRHGLHGVVLREEAFAHLSGGRDIETGTEPLYAWIRVSVKDRNPLVQRETCGFLIQVTRPHLHFEMYTGRNVLLREDESPYPRELTLEPQDDGSSLLIEPDDKVRLAIMPGPGAEVTRQERKEGVEHPLLWVEMPTTIGAHVDILLPMIPQERAGFAREMALGHDGARADSNRYWSKRPATAATITTPEPYINELIRRNVQFGEVIAQRMPGSGHYTNLTGSLVYCRMWATPTTMFDTMLLDTMGYHDAVDRYLEIFRATQGTATPPGPSYKPHAGYLATPRSLSAYDWLSDHGAIMHAVSYHALLTDDSDFVDRWLEPLLKACEFIRDVRAITGHEGVPGVLPPAVATDRSVPTQAVWNVGWHYKGLTSAVRLLERLKHPRAAEFAAEAEDYRATFVKALRAHTAKSPTWTDADGVEHHVVPTSLSPGSDITHGFYLDTGPMSLVYLGLLDASDPLMVSSRKFFREGPNTRLFDPHGHFAQPPVLVHELSSCEPCWGWAFFHSHQLLDRARYLESLYSLLTGAHSRQTFVMCETRGGITGIATHEGTYLVRLSAIDDVIEDDALHLLRLVPKAWLSKAETTRFDNVPTVYGPVSLRFGLDKGGQRLTVSYEPRFHHSPKRVLLHVPPVDGLSEITINGVTHDASPGKVFDIE